VAVKLVPGRISRRLKKKLKRVALRLAVAGLPKDPDAVFSGLIWRSGRRGSATSGVSRTRGRPTRLMVAEDKYMAEPVPTVKAAIRDGWRMPLAPLPRDRWRRTVRVSRLQVTAMLVMDASRSSTTYLVSLSEVLRSLFERFFDPASKVGMVTIEEGTARLLFSPTRNRLRVFGRVKDLRPGGFTPLEQALRLARMELLRLRKLDTIYRSFIILVSDCYPEPLPEGIAEPYESDLYKRVRLQATLLRGSRIPVAVIDPSSIRAEFREAMPGRRLARFISSVTGGVFISLPAAEMTFGGPLTPRFIVEARKGLEALHVAEQLRILENVFAGEKMRAM
jgi:Mg-chelatase subunit ChlD